VTVAKEHLQKTLDQGLGLLVKGETFEIIEVKPIRIKGERWDAQVPFAKDVQAGTKTCKVGSFEVKYNKGENTAKDARWQVIGNDGEVKESHSQYWDAVQAARKLSTGKVPVAA
jgi:hypothetical protein